MFIAALTATLFRPPDLNFYSLDRIAFLILIFVVILRMLAQQQPFWFAARVTVPMLGLLIIAFCSVWIEPYAAENWSLFAAKWLVPFVLYHLAAFVFADPTSIRQFEVFALVVLAYLTLTAVFFLVDARWLIFPRYILNENIGIHADRARGPFLQAVANGMTLNLLGIIALDSVRRNRLSGLFAAMFAVALPLAILATRTRTVWATYGVSLVAMPFISNSPRVKRSCLLVLICSGTLLGGYFAFENASTSLNERLRERRPVEFRIEMFGAGWEMFLEKPLAGWNATSIQPELGRRVSDFHPPYFIFHNTYLEIAVKHGLIGLGLYAWVFVDLFRLGGRRQGFRAPPRGNLLDADFRRIWPLLLVVYVVNASFVVMSYQFVNGLLFTFAGMLAAQNRLAAARVVFERAA